LQGPPLTHVCTHGNSGCLPQGTPGSSLHTDQQLTTACHPGSQERNQAIVFRKLSQHAHNSRNSNARTSSRLSVEGVGQGKQQTQRKLSTYAWHLLQLPRLLASQHPAAWIPPLALHFLALLLSLQQCPGDVTLRQPHQLLAACW
jgi:hypothetical protein